MKKVTKIDLSSDRLIAIAADLVEEHNYIGALKMLNKNAELNYNDEDSYMLYAEIFDDLGLYEKCVNYWFSFIDCAECDDEQLGEAYEGLAVAYMNLGNEHFSAYYYNKLLMDADDIDADTRGEILDSFLAKEENPLKFVYPPKLADFSDIMSTGIDAMKRGEYDEAIREFEKVDEGNEAYLSARNYIAMCDIISDRCEQAEQECLSILNKNPENVQALTTLAAVKSEQKNTAESRALAQRLLSLNVTNTDDIYKIATVCCENKMHGEALGLFKKLEADIPYDNSVLYFHAVSAFNSGDFGECFSAFDKLSALNPDSVTVKYHYKAAREAAEKGENDEMSYFYRLPQTERESSLKILAAFSRLNAAETKKFLAVADIADCVLWCFEETEGGSDGELQFLGAMCAVKAGLDGLVASLLLNAFLSDSLKIKILTLIGERNENNGFGAVICHIYKRIYFRALELGRLKRKNFIAAYARLTAHFAIIDSDYGEKFALAAENLYCELEERGRLSSAADVDALTAAIYYRSEVSEPKITSENLSAFFETTDKKILDILGEF